MTAAVYGPPVPGPYLPQRILPDGRSLDLYPLLFGRWRLGVALATELGQGFYDEVWEFPNIQPAMLALLEWDGAGDPEGWDRHR